MLRSKEGWSQMNRLFLRLATLAVPMAVAAVSEPIIDFTRPIGKANVEC